MTNDVMLGSLYILMAMMLVLGALINRREPLAKMLTMFLAWVAIFGAGFILFSFRDDLGYVGQRLKAETTGAPLVESGGVAVRVPMAIDGHFWVKGELNGVPTRFLVESGATMTTINRAAARAAGVAVSAGPGPLVRTGNGIVQVATGRADTLNIATIERRNVGLHIVETDDMNVLGMNYLSSLKRWGVEGRWLVMEP